MTHKKKAEMLILCVLCERANSIYNGFDELYRHNGAFISNQKENNENGPLIKKKRIAELKAGNKWMKSHFNTYKRDQETQ